MIIMLPSMQLVYMQLVSCRRHKSDWSRLGSWKNVISINQASKPSEGGYALSTVVDGRHSHTGSASVLI